MSTNAEFFTDRFAGTRVPVNDLEGLMDCARYNEEGDMEVLKDYLNKYPMEINAQDGQGRTVVHMAAANGRLDVLEVLMTYNPKPNMQNEHGNSALHFAALNNRVEVAAFLLSKGWKANLKNNFGKTPLQLIAQQKLDEMEVLLLNHDDSLDGSVPCHFTDYKDSPSPPAKDERRHGAAPVPAPPSAPSPSTRSAQTVEAQPTKEGLLGSAQMDGVE